MVTRYILRRKKMRRKIRIERKRKSIKSNLEFILLAVDDDSCNLLVHEDQNDGKQGGDDRCKDQPHRIFVRERINEPTLSVWVRRLKSRVSILIQGLNLIITKQKFQEKF